MSATLHRSPQWGPTSHNKSARACTNLWADVFPVRVSDSSLSRSSFVSVTLYRGTILYHRTELGFRIRHPLRYCLLAEIAVHTLSNIESGKGNPSLEVLGRLFDCLGLKLTIEPNVPGDSAPATSATAETSQHP
jgi:hypothetical protein